MKAVKKEFDSIRYNLQEWWILDKVLQTFHRYLLIITDSALFNPIFNLVFRTSIYYHNSAYLDFSNCLSFSNHCSRSSRSYLIA